MSPESPELLQRLLRLLWRAGRPADAEALLKKRIQTAKGPEKLKLLLQLVELSAQTGRPAEAAEALQTAISLGAEEGKYLPRLAELYEKAGRTRELNETLARLVELAETAGDTEKVARLKLKRAQLQGAPGGDQSEAVRSYADILRQRPSDPDALTALEGMLATGPAREEAARALLPAYELTKDHRKLVAALDVLAEVAKDDSARAQALRQAAHAHLTHLRQPELAFASLARAMRLTPGDAGLRATARQAAEDADELDSFAEILEELTEEEKAGPARAQILRELADVQEKKLDDKAGAIKALHALLALEPTNVDCLKALQRLHRAGEQWAEVAEVLEKLASVSTETAEQVAYLREAALLHESKLSNKERAAAAWRAIAEKDPLQREAAASLDRLYTELGMTQELAWALSLRRSQEGQSPQGREVSFRLAELLRTSLNNPNAALKLYERILAEDPGHPGARAALEEWVKAALPTSRAALETLDPVLKQVGDHARRVALREARMESALTVEKAQLAAEIRQIYEQEMQQPSLAFMAAVKAFASGIDREALQPDLERLARETGSHETLAEIYEDAATDLPSGDAVALALLRRTAELREQLNQPEEAARLWKNLLQEAPQDRQALEALSRLYEKGQNAKNLSEVYAKQAQISADPEARRGLLLKAGDAYASAGDDAKAIEAYRSALAIKKSPEGLLALDKLFAKAAPRPGAGGRAGPAGGAGGGRRVPPWLHPAPRPAAGAGGEPRARRCWATARWWNWCRAIRRASRAWSACSRRRDRGWRRRACSSPSTGASTTRRKLVEVLEVLLSSAPPEQRLERTNEIAVLREALGQTSLAFAARLRAFNEFPQAPSVLDELERLAADSGSFEEVAAAYEDQLERGTKEPLAGELWRRLAAVYDGRLKRYDLAVRALEEVSRRDPYNKDVLEAIARTHRRTGAHRDLALVMRRQVAADNNVSSQVNLLFELGHLAEDTLSDKALAAQAYREVLERRPENGNALKLLAKVLTGNERWPELAQHIEREIQGYRGRANAVEEASELRVRLGRLKLTRLDDPSRRARIVPSGARAPGRPCGSGRRAGGDGALRRARCVARRPAPWSRCSPGWETTSSRCHAGGASLRGAGAPGARGAARGASPNVRRAHAERGAGVRVRSAGPPGAAG